MSLFFNTLSRFVIAFLLRSKCLFISWLQSPTIHSDFGAQENKICHGFQFFPIYLSWSDGTGCRDLKFFGCWVLSQLFHSLLSPPSSYFSSLCFQLLFVFVCSLYPELLRETKLQKAYICLFPAAAPQQCTRRRPEVFHPLKSCNWNLHTLLVHFKSSCAKIITCISYNYTTIISVYHFCFSSKENIKEKWKV